MLDDLFVLFLRACACRSKPQWRTTAVLPGTALIYLFSRCSHLFTCAFYLEMLLVKDHCSDIQQRTNKNQGPPDSTPKIVQRQGFLAFGLANTVLLGQLQYLPRSRLLYLSRMQSLSIRRYFHGERPSDCTKCYRPHQQTVSSSLA